MSAAETLLSQARAQLSRQEAAVDTLRTRAMAVFSASGVVAALFGPKALASEHQSVWEYAALALLLGGAVAAAYVLAPRDMTFTAALDEWWEWCEANERAPDRDDAVAIGLAKNLDEVRKLNVEAMDRIANGYVALCVAFAFQVVAWVAGVLVS